MPLANTVKCKGQKFKEQEQNSKAKELRHLRAKPSESKHSSRGRASGNASTNDRRRNRDTARPGSRPGFAELDRRNQDR